MQFAKKGLYRTYWQWRAAKDLEPAVQINPREFYAWHNYGDLNSNAGDLGMMNEYSNARRAVTAFTRAIALNPKSARLGLDRTGESRLTLVRPPLQGARRRYADGRPRTSDGTLCGPGLFGGHRPTGPRNNRKCTLGPIVGITHVPRGPGPSARLAPTRGPPSKYLGLC